MPQIPPTPTPLPEQSGASLTYDAVIGPLFQSRCGSCHGDGGIQGLNLTTYQTALAGGVSGPAIVPGDPDSSLVVQKQTADKPHFSQLTPQELDRVIQWIEAGAPEN
jgi:mono/diheme cytochrome c family protein